MIITIHQKILLKKILAKYGVNANKLCTQANSNHKSIRKEAREQLSYLINYCTGKGVMFSLNHPYTKSYKSHRSTLRDREARHSQEVQLCH